MLEKRNVRYQICVCGGFSFDQFGLYIKYFTKTKEKITGVESGNCFLFSTFPNRFGSVSELVGLRETGKHFSMAPNFAYVSKQSLHYRSNLSFKSSERQVIYGKKASFCEG